jgi:hypothetical protein
MIQISEKVFDLLRNDIIGATEGGTTWDVRGDDSICVFSEHDSGEFYLTQI